MDREKVIEELERLSEWFFLQYQVVYDGDAPDYYDAYKTVDDALALLKEQEAVEPYMDYDGHDVWRCGNCGATIFHIEHSQADEDWKSYAKFCRQCGKKVKWDDEH